MATRKLNKTKIATEDLNDLLNESQYLKDSPLAKKTTQKRQRNNVPEDEEEISKLLCQFQTKSKKKKQELNVEACTESRQKILDVMGHQLETRKEKNDGFLKFLSEFTTELEADYNAMKENEKKLEHLTGAVVKCMQQSTAAHKQNLKVIKEVAASFKKQVEGLLTKGAMKADDRPLWFDVYRAFPPLTEPKFAKSKPEIKPIRQILYPEDAIRAKFHSKGLGLGAISMVSQAETTTKKLIQQYEKLKAEGVPEEELIDKSAAAVGSERQEAAKAKPTVTNPESITAKVLAEADIKNIFNEK